MEMSRTKFCMERVEPKTRLIERLPEEWGTEQQRKNLLDSLKGWARGNRFATVRIEPIEKPLIFGFRHDEKVFRVQFLKKDETGQWEYSISAKGLCENSSYPLGSAPSEEPKLLYSWKDFEKGVLPKPGEKEILPKPREVLPKPGET